MKKLLVLLVLLVSGLGYSQSHNDILEKWYNENKLAVEKEFVRLIDSARSSVMIEKLFHYRSKNGFTQKELRKIKKTEKLNGSVVSVTRRNYKKYRLKIDRVNVIKDVSVEKIVYDSLLSLASEHHAKYLTEVVPKSGYISHQEYEDYYGYKYEGTLPILEHPSDRVKYYCPERSYQGECASYGIVGHIATLDSEAQIDFYIKNLNHINVKSVAFYLFQVFKNSPKHWEAYMNPKDINLMGTTFIMDFQNQQMSFVSVMGNEKNKYVPEIVEVYKK
jgi:hypothetical protein